MCLLAWNECTKWLSFQTSCLRVVFCQVFHRSCTFQCSANSVCYLADRFTIHLLTLFFLFWQKVCLLAWNECTKWLSFQTSCLRVVFCQVFHRSCTFQCSANSVCYLADRFTIHLLTLFFLFSRLNTVLKGC